METTTIYVLVMSCDELRALWTNDAYRHLIELGGDDRHIVGRRFEEFAPVTTSTGFTDRIRDVVRTGEPYTIESFEIADIAKGATEWAWSVYRVPLGPEPVLLVVGHTRGKPVG